MLPETVTLIGQLDSDTTADNNNNNNNNNNNRTTTKLLQQQQQQQQQLHKKKTTEETEKICNSSITVKMENLADGGACVRGDYIAFGNDKTLVFEHIVTQQHLLQKVQEVLVYN